MPDSGELVIYTIYERPRDYPESYVVRPHRMQCGLERGTVFVPDPEPLAVTATLDEARARLPHARGLFNLGRDAKDEPQIVESWI